MNYVSDGSGVSSLNMARLAVPDDAGSDPSFDLSVDADALLPGAQVGDEVLLIDYTGWRRNGINSDQPTGDSVLPYIDFNDLSSVIQGELVNDTDNTTVSYKITAIPEPASLSLMGIGMLLIARCRRTA